MSWRTIDCFTIPRARLGWVLVMFGVLAWWLFGQYADWSAIAFKLSTISKTNGSVVSSTPTGYTSGDEFNGKTIYAVRFSFTNADGIVTHAKSWTENSLAPGTRVPVEYTERTPSIARIVGHRSGMLPLWVGAVLLFPAVGASMIVSVLLGQTSAYSQHE